MVHLFLSKQMWYTFRRESWQVLWNHIEFFTFLPTLIRTNHRAIWVIIVLYTTNSQTNKPWKSKRLFFCVQGHTDVYRANIGLLLKMGSCPAGVILVRYDGYTVYSSFFDRTFIIELIDATLMVHWKMFFRYLNNKSFSASWFKFWGFFTLT